VGKNSKRTSICNNRGGGGVQELIHVGGMLASTIFSRHGGGFTTSSEEALLQSSSGCSKPPIRKVTCSPRVEGGPLLQIVVGKGLPSSRLRFLGGFAWRTPTSGDGDARGLDCNFSFGSRVVCLKRMALFVDRRSHMTRLERDFLIFVPITVLLWAQLVACKESNQAPGEQKPG
jgi:hypothetical protein